MKFDRTAALHRMSRWVESRALNGGSPGYYMDVYEAGLNAGLVREEWPIDLTDPVQAAGEIEALCTLRSLHYMEHPEKAPVRKVDGRTIRLHGPSGRFVSNAELARAK